MMHWVRPEDIVLATSLATYLDKKIIVSLIDGRAFIGTLRSFDHFGNTFLEETFERVVVGDLLCDIPLGLFLIRGENVGLVGELDSEKEKELSSRMTRVSTRDIRKAQKEAADLKGSSMKKKEISHSEW